MNTNSSRLSSIMKELEQNVRQLNVKVRQLHTRSNNPAANKYVIQVGNLEY